MPPSPNQTAQVKQRSRAESFSALIRDRRISHGAFRLFHLLRDHQNPKSGACFPGRRLQMESLGSDHHCLKRWTDELVASGWLKVLPREKGEVFHYELLDGQGQPWGKSTTLGVVEKHHGKGVGQKHHRVWRKSTTDRGGNAPQNLKNLSDSYENKLTSAPSASGLVPKAPPQPGADNPSCVGRF